MTTLHLDLETFSTVPIKHGAHRYAEEAEVLLVALAVDDGLVEVSDVSDSGAWADCAHVIQGAIDASDEIVIHGSTFDRTVLRHCGVHIPVGKITDTMILALEHGLPAALGQLCDVLRVPQDKTKDKEGKQLIQLFTKPRPKNSKLRRATRETHPDEWQRFIEYARRDVDSMREVRRRIPAWNYSRREIDLWRIDQRINDRGVAVDTDLARSALRAFERASRSLATAASHLTDGAIGSATQRQALKDHLRDAHGFHTDDLQKKTVESLLADEDTPEAVRALLENRLQAAATSPAKYQSLLNSVSSDGRLRGTIQFCGASRTHRDSGRIFQIQNLMRPTLEHEVIESGIAAMKLDGEDLLFENVVEICSNAVRGCLVAAEGCKLVVSDLSNIEGRVLAWLAGEDWKLKAFKDYDAGIGHDLYRVTAGRILEKNPGDIDKTERQNQGKVPELAGGYGGSLGAYREMGGAVFNAMSDDAILTIVKAWREAHKRTVNLWYDVERAARSAIENPGDSFTVGKLVFDTRRDEFGVLWLRMKLPNGAFISYPRVEIEYDFCFACDEGKIMFEHEGVTREMTCPECGGRALTGRGRITFEGLDQYTHQWKRLDTWGGKIVAEATQSTAREIFMHGMRCAEEAGYPVVLRVHDELVCEVPDTPEYSAEQLALIMSINPGWSAGLPLAAAGFSCYRYRKD